MFFSPKQLYLAFLLGLAWASDPRYVLSHKVVEGKEFRADALKIPAGSYSLTVSNSPLVLVKGILQSRAPTLFLTNETAVGNAQGLIEYDFNGRIINGNLFVVQHNNRDLPLHLTFHGGLEDDFPRDFYSANYRNMVFSSNGPAKLSGGKEFEIDLLKTFSNQGFLAVVGTNLHTAQVAFRRQEGGLPTAGFLNNGIFHLKNAVAIQGADLLLLGCILLGENSVFYANSSFLFGEQKLQFLPGAATLSISSTGGSPDARYFVTSFPLGSSILFEKHMTELQFDGNNVTVSSTAGDDSVVIEFLHSRPLHPENFVFVGGRLTLKVDLTRRFQTWRCRQWSLAVKLAADYEVKTDLEEGAEKIPLLGKAEAAKQAARISEGRRNWRLRLKESFMMANEKKGENAVAEASERVEKVEKATQTEEQEAVVEKVEHVESKSEQVEAGSQIGESETVVKKKKHRARKRPGKPRPATAESKFEDNETVLDDNGAEERIEVGTSGHHRAETVSGGHSKAVAEKKFKIVSDKTTKIVSGGSETGKKDGNVTGQKSKTIRGKTIKIVSGGCENCKKDVNRSGEKFGILSVKKIQSVSGVTRTGKTVGIVSGENPGLSGENAKPSVVKADPSGKKTEPSAKKAEPLAEIKTGDIATKLAKKRRPRHRNRKLAAKQGEKALMEEAAAGKETEVASTKTGEPRRATETPPVDIVELVQENDATLNENIESSPKKEAALNENIESSQENEPPLSENPESVQDNRTTFKEDVDPHHEGDIFLKEDVEPSQESEMILKENHGSSPKAEAILDENLEPSQNDPALNEIANEEKSSEAASNAISAENKETEPPVEEDDDFADLIEWASSKELTPVHEESLEDVGEHGPANKAMEEKFASELDEKKDNNGLGEGPDEAGENKNEIKNEPDEPVKGNMEKLVEPEKENKDFEDELVEPEKKNKDTEEVFDEGEERTTPLGSLENVNEAAENRSPLKEFEEAAEESTPSETLKPSVEENDSLELSDEIVQEGSSSDGLDEVTEYDIPSSELDDLIRKEEASFDEFAGASVDVEPSSSGLDEDTVHENPLFNADGFKDEGFKEELDEDALYEDDFSQDSLDEVELSQDKPRETENQEDQLVQKKLNQDEVEEEKFNEVKLNEDGVNGDGLNKDESHEDELNGGGFIEDDFNEDEFDIFEFDEDDFSEDDFSDDELNEEEPEKDKQNENTENSLIEDKPVEQKPAENKFPDEFNAESLDSLFGRLHEDSMEYLTAFNGEHLSSDDEFAKDFPEQMESIPEEPDESHEENENKAVPKNAEEPGPLGLNKRLRFRFRV